MRNVMVTKYGQEPPARPLMLNGVLYDEWLNVETKEAKKWNGREWINSGGGDGKNSS